MNSVFAPKLFTEIKSGISIKKLQNDLIAGIVVGIVAMPLAIAIAISSGVKPEYGLYTAIVGGFLISFFSGSRVQIGGPTGAFIVIVFKVVQEHGYQGLAVATVMAGIILIALGLLKAGAVLKYIPYPVTVGFTAGIAVIIAVSQFRDFAGLQMEEIPADFIEKIQAYATHLNTFNGYTLLIGFASLLLIFGLPKITKKIPASLTVIIATALLVKLLNLPVETIGTRFGGIPAGLPQFTVPGIFDLNLIREMIPSAITIAMLAGIESLLSAVVADGMTGFRHRSNTELIAQGIANIASPFFCGIPITGAIARTATNIRNGGRTPFAGIFHAITLLLIMLFFGKWAALIPMPALAAILIGVSFNMGEWHLFARLMKAPRSDALILLTTFLLTVIIDLTVAIETGVIMAALLFMKRMAETSRAGWVIQSEEEIEDETHDAFSLKNYEIPDKIEVFEINGPFFFGAADKFRQALIENQKSPDILILRMRNVTAMDATGLRALETVAKQFKKQGTTLLISGIHKQPAQVIIKSGLAEKIGHDRIHKNIEQALEHAKTLLAE